jgi:GDPmannose 4,6-dehydratase
MFGETVVSARVEPAALITGVAGQDGVYLATLLQSQGYRVVGTTYPGSASRTRLAPYLDGIEVVGVDVRDDAGMRELVRAVRPDEVYNLAAVSSVGEAWSDAERVAQVNADAVARLLETLARYRDDTGVEPRFFQASSAEIFGVAIEQPQDEDTPRQPQSPYGIAKLAAHDRVVRSRREDGLFACNGILFNHESPLRAMSFVTRKITRTVAAIAEGLASELSLGNLDVRRDWGAAADHVRAMWLMLQQPTAADYVIATGTVSSLRDIVEIAFAAVGIDEPWPYVRHDPGIARPVDPPQTWGDPSRARQDLGWEPTTTLAELIQAMVAVDVERLRSGVEESPSYLSSRA